MTLAARFALLGLLLVPADRAMGQGVSSQFIGTWRLVSIQGDTAGGRNRGSRPTGYISYDATGRMGVQI